MAIVTSRCWWFGCWLEPGHYLVGVGGRGPARDCPFYQYDWTLDGGYAPRRWTSRHEPPVSMHDDHIVFSMMAGEADREGRHKIIYGSEEVAQGLFLRHEAHGCTLISWWDRTQGDTRGACNSTFIVEGSHHVDQMLLWFPQVFPAQAKRLADAGVALVCVNKALPGSP